MQAKRSSAQSRKRARASASAERRNKAARSSQSKAIVKAGPPTVSEAIEKVLIGGDLTPLTPEQRVEYYNAVCNSLGLNRLTGPFGYILFRETENAPAKLSLYAKKDCAEQLRKKHRVSVIPRTTKREITEDFATTELSLVDGSGRTDTATGMVYLWKKYNNQMYRLTGQRLADAIMKSETKAKRRGTLSICGLGILDEMDLESVRVVGGVTPDGRIFKYDTLDLPPSDEPPTQQLDEHAAHGHPEGSERAKQAEAALRRVEEEDQRLREAKTVQAKPVEAKPTEKSSPSGASVAALPILEAERTEKGSYIIRGDVQANEAIFDLIHKYCVFLEGWWQCPDEQDLKNIAVQQEPLGFALKRAQKIPAGSMSGKTDKKPPEKTRGETQPELITGTIERATTGMTSKNAPTRQVKIGKTWYTSYVNTIFEFLDKGVGREAEVYIDQRKNIVGLKRVGKTEFDADGRTPAVQRKDQEAGSKTLFGV